MATAGKDRAWKVSLLAVSANRNPQKLTVMGKSKTLVLDHVLVGDVWVLGGQSNMEFELAKVENGNPQTREDYCEKMFNAGRFGPERSPARLHAGCDFQYLLPRRS